MSRRRTATILSLALVALVAAGAAVLAGGAKPYSEQAVQAAQADGKVIVLDFHASWCPTCRKQEAIIADLAKEPAMKNVAVFKVDFDGAKKLKKAHEVSRQSTLVVLKEGKEVARATGLTSKDSIRELINRAL